ncbi:MAG TPA: hypothetical protein VGM24_01425 [Puia sp.]|jgi:hypothetical protein
MKLKPGLVFLISLTALIFSGCNKKNPLKTDIPADYYPIQVGKYIIYRMDSLKFINIGSQDTTISYLAKEVVEDSLTDNLGRPSYRVVRYLSDTTGTQPWEPSVAYLVTPTSQSVEVVDNNLRFIKLVTPVQDYISWKGNVYIDTKSVNSQVPYMDDWNYTYANTGQPYDVLEGTIPETVIVNEENETSGIEGSYSQTIISVEVYGKGIGPIYKNFLHSEYQAPNLSNPAGTTIGYGLTFNMVSHN